MNASLRAVGLMSLWLLPGTSHAAFRFFDPTVQASIPDSISQTGIYTDIPGKIPDPALKYYEVNAPLWSDGAEKKRWIVLPPGKKVVYQDSTDLFVYPDSTVFVKNFSLRRLDADSTTEVLWETRLLVNKNDSMGLNHWYGFSYKWNAARTQALRVNADSGFDTTFIYYPNGLTGPQSYKKWHYPSQLECNVCHPITAAPEAGLARSVAGFFPVQLKRPAPLQPGINQVQWLFDQGVFSGTAPTSPAQLAHRWKRVTESIPAGPEDLRFRVLDTMARSYIGANCSACHGRRGIESGLAAPQALNYDWFEFVPHIEFGTATGQSVGLVEDTSLELAQPSRRKYVFAAVKAGLDTSAGSVWNMPVPGPEEGPTFIRAGHPELSTLLYRQLGARNTPWMDSVEMRRRLAINGDPLGWSAWIFTDPWGSEPWRNALAAHTVPLNTVITYYWDGEQMPRVATYIPDTSAMRVLGEWAKKYRTLVRVEGQDSVVNVRGRLVRIPAQRPQLQGRILVLPAGWSGKARMFDPRGRAWLLSSAGPNRYVLPAAAPAGLYFFKVGERSFRASVMSR